MYTNGKFVYVNPAAVKLLCEHHESELIGRSVFDIIHPDYREFVRQRVKAVTENGLAQPMVEEKFLCLDGTAVDAEVVSVPITYKGLASVQVVARDITEPKQMGEALRESQERYWTLAEAAHDIIFIIDRHDRVEYVNTSAAELFQRRPEEIIGKIWVSLFPPEISSGQQISLQSVFETGMHRYVESKAARMNQVIWLGSWLVPLRDDAGQINDVMGVSRDITNRKWLEDDKQKLLNKLQEALAQVKTLGGLLPICSVCKKIRDDQGYWQQVESYIQHHTDATFTHGVCPDCFPKLYPDFDSIKSDET